MWCAAASAWLAVGLAHGASAEDPNRVMLDVTLVHVSDTAGGVDSDPRARRADQILGKQLRYESLKVVRSLRRELPVDEIWSVTLPTGRHFRLRPMDVGSNGVLLSVDVERSTQGDFRVLRRKPLALGGQSYQGGQLVIIVEPDY